MIQRIYEDLANFFHPKEVLILYGARRVGKTTLLDNFLKVTKLRYRLDTGDNIRTQELLSSLDLSRIKEYVEGYELLAIDEAQFIPHIGKALKIIIDTIPGIKVIVTGSSSFDLSQEVGEPLTGRKTTLTMYPISQLELLKSNKNKFDLKQKLEEFLIYGSYPQIVTATSRDEKNRIITELVNSYLFKDILALETIKAPRLLLDLLKLLAFQIGSEVSFNELSTQLGFDVKTVARYIDLLEKTFVIIRLGGFSRNLRSEVTSKAKYYFLDNGIRNGVISQFNELSLRNDIGQLWENFIITERLKKRTYTNIYGQSYFWRTYEQREIDLIEERDGELYPFECKWSMKEVKPIIPRDWVTAYPLSKELGVIHPDNYLDFVAE
ncbi:ATP-binding protein [Candidatus Roizmanbacteria bacterium]|nr:ATP-binding protein [Candidatus Roizmanbacteria bacterium]